MFYKRTKEPMIELPPKLDTIFGGAVHDIS